MSLFLFRVWVYNIYDIGFIMKKAKTLILLSLAIGLCCSVGVIHSFKGAKQEVVAEAANQHIDNFDRYYYEGSYYNGVPNGQGMEGTLRQWLTSNNFPDDWYAYSGTGSGTLAEMFKSADEDPSNTSNMVFLYTRDSITKSSMFSKNWNREHCWPRSTGNWQYAQAGADLYHIRPTYATPNSTRGNHRYGIVNNDNWSEYDGMKYGKLVGDTFEPLDSVKGDVARIVMYIWVTYKDYYSPIADITNVFESFDTMLKWHTMDAPDEMEGHRNEVGVASRQKNRNPFVDKPEYAWMIFGEQCSKSVVDAAKAAYPEGGSSVSLESITVGAAKTQYAIDEPLIKPTITAHYDDGSSKIVTSNCVFSNYDMSVEGNYEVEVAYTENGETQFAYYYINVSSSVVPTVRTPASLELTNIEDTYFVGDELIKPEVTVKYETNEEAVVTDKAVFSGYNMSVEGDYIVSVSYTENSKTVTTSYPISVSEIEAEYLIVNNSHYNYYVGDTFEKPEVTAYYSNGLSADVSNECEYEYDLTVLGNQNVTVRYTYGGSSVYQTYQINVNEVAPSSISVASGSKVNFYQGDAFVKPTVILSYNNGQTEDVTDDAVCSGYDMNTVGNQLVTVTYTTGTSTFTTKYTIRINTVPTVTLKKINVLSDSKTVFEYGEAFTRPHVEAVYSDNSTKDVSDSENLTVSGFDSTVVGNKRLAVSYLEKGKTVSTSYLVTINAPAPIPCIITFDNNGGTGTMTPISDKNVGDSIILPNASELTPPSGKEFKAWEIDGVEYQPGATCALTSSVVTIKALWKDIAPVPATLVSITAVDQVTEYQVGATIDKSTVTVTGTYSDSSSRVLAASEYDLSYDFSAIGDNVVVTVTASGKSATYTVKVVAPAPTPTPEPSGVLISLTVTPTVTTYNVGDTIDKSTLTVVANYSDGSKTLDPYQYTLKYDFSKAGSVNVTVSHTSGNVTKTKDYTVTVTGGTSIRGCSGSVISTSVILSSLTLVGISLLIIKKRKARD